jgi:hypothetical protein
VSPVVRSRRDEFAFYTYTLTFSLKGRAPTRTGVHQ